MGERTKIAWCRSTMNPWIGCSKVGTGCDHCYAEALDKRHKWGGAVHWGPGVPRFRTSAKNWAHPIEWNKLAALEQRTGIRTLGSDWKGKIGFWPVFCASLADVFDNEVPEEWRDDLFHLIAATPNLSWLLVTKRIGNVAKMTQGYWDMPNVRLLITVCNQEEADRDIPKLLALPCKNGISYEPALGPVDWTRISLGKAPMQVGAAEFRETEFTINALKGAHSLNWPGLGWIIVGGESTQGSGKARPFDLAWARNTIAQCKTAGVPVFVKQLGSSSVWSHYPPQPSVPIRGHRILSGPVLKHRAGADPAEWPEDLKVQEFPE